MSALAPLLEVYRRSLPDRRTSGFVPTAVPGVHFFWNEHSVPRAPLMYSAGLVILGQGRKVGYLGSRRFEYDKDSCLVLGIPVPFECEAFASHDEPLLGIRIDIDMRVLYGLVGRLHGQLDGEERNASMPHAGVEPVTMEGALLDASVRLVECLPDRLDSQVLGPAAVEEILYRVLRREQGRVLLALTRHQSAYAGIARALDRIHRDYRETLAVENLALECAMSASAFHRAFKEVTGDSPLQYIKKLRLLKAKGLLVIEGLRVEEAAHGVGYASASQFSREFKRYFNVPPSEAETLPYSESV